MPGDPAAARLLRRRLIAQGLAGGGVSGAAAGGGVSGAAAVTRRLLAIQGQDPRGARLAIRARAARDSGLTGADVDRALSDERTLVLTWLNRGTLHLVAAEDYPLLQALTTRPQRTANATRLAQLGIDADATARGVALIDRVLADRGPLTGAQLRESLARGGIAAVGQRLVHLLFAASLDGVLVRGPMLGADHGYARVADWLPDAGAQAAAVAADRERALGELARRYLVAHGPADARDLARWAGLGLRDARVGLAAIAPRLREEGDGLVALDDPAGGSAGREAGGSARRDRLPRWPAPRLLGAFEPLLMGWRSRAEVLGDHESDVVTGGIFRGFALVRGRAAGVWRFAGAGVELAPFGAPEPSVARALERDAAAVVTFLGR